mmetsp:Transcript_16224/g.44070  ORF Transcript_16224/g.44070 Transcript_16224/m.44070 type:complete len:341 (-) Transcript_16224:382-1404(-)
MGDSREHVSAKVIAQRLGELLFHFPAAAVKGVRWSLLMQTYEEVYHSRLDIKRLGYSTALAASTALLWDVLRLTDGEDVDDPVVALEDEATLVLVPGLLGSWPAIYQALSSIVQTSGSLEPMKDGNRFHPVRTLTLEKLEPLLKRQWEVDFEEGGVKYLEKDAASALTLSTFQEMLEAVLRWTQERTLWLAERNMRPTSIDKVFQPRLEIIESRSDVGEVTVCLRCVLVDVWVDEEYFAPPQQPNLAAFEERLRSESRSSTAPLPPQEPSAQHQEEVTLLEEEKPTSKEEVGVPSTRRKSVPPTPQATVDSNSPAAKKPTDSHRIPKGIVSRFRNHFEVK